MFTGIITKIGKVKSVHFERHMAKLVISVDALWDSLALGESIAVNGVCLTVTEIQKNTFSVDVSRPTLQATTLGKLACGSRVNLERALALSDRLGGHIVQGHVDAVAYLEAIEKEEANIYLTFRVSREIAADLILKGSVAVDGVSLTIQRLEPHSFTVVVIPHTFQNTTFSLLPANGAVNIETDVLSKYVKKHVLAHEKTPLSLEFLKKMGF
jgi:riboflavin synthase